MALIEADGTLTTTASEQNFFDITTAGPKYFTTTLFTHNMTSTETFRIRVYLYDSNASAYRTVLDENITGAQDPPAFYIPTMLSKQYKVSIVRTAGTDKAVTWKRFEQT